jgi:NADH-quinone oxidoreductase subunit I
MGITLKHFFDSYLDDFKWGIRRYTTDEGFAARQGTETRGFFTVQYPEEKVTYPERYRGLHRLMLREDGAVRCVACMCCPTVCPAHCITIIPAEVDNKGVEKAPAVFEIDELRCVVCGLCVEACPCDAIRMDTGMHATSVEDRADAIETLESMKARGIRSTAVQGGEGPDWRAGGHETSDHEVNR